MNVLGIVAHTLGYGDACACLYANGRIAGIIEEERFTRIRYDDGFPNHSIQCLLDIAGITGRDIDLIALHLSPYRNLSNRLYWLLRNAVYTVPNSVSYLRCFLHYGNIKKEIQHVLESDRFQIEYYGHHECHAAASFYTSPFDRAAFLTLDGTGEGVTGTYGIADRNHGIRVFKRFPYPHSIGFAYSAVCDHLGFPAPAGPGNPPWFHRQR